MSSRRVQKVAQAIREVVSMAILTDLKDPRVRDVTVTSVEVSGDLRQAKVNVSIMGDDTRQSLSLRGLQSSAGFLQAKIGARIDTRYIPKLEFVLDQGVKKSIEIARLLAQVLPAEGSESQPLAGQPGAANAGGRAGKQADADEDDLAEDEFDDNSDDEFDDDDGLEDSDDDESDDSESDDSEDDDSDGDENEDEVSETSDSEDNPSQSGRRPKRS